MDMKTQCRNPSLMEVEADLTNRLDAIGAPSPGSLAWDDKERLEALLAHTRTADDMLCKAHNALPRPPERFVGAVEDLAICATKVCNYLVLMLPEWQSSTCNLDYPKNLPDINVLTAALGEWEQRLKSRCYRYPERAVKHG